MRNVFVPSREWSKKVKSTKTANGYTKTFLKSRAHYSLVLSNCRLATFHREVNNRRYRVFLEYRLTKLERVSQQNSLPQYFVQSCLKVFCINAPMPRGLKAILFVFISHSLLRVLGELESANFGFEWFSFHVYCELETKTVSNFPRFLSSPTVMSKVLFPTIMRQCSRPLYDYEG